MLIRFNKLNIGDKFIRIQENNTEASEVLIKHSKTQASNDLGMLIPFDENETIAKLKTKKILKTTSNWR